MPITKAAIALAVSRMPLSSLSSLPKSAWQAYVRALVKRPLLTRALTSGVILGAADYTCQKVEKQEKINPRRVAAMAMTGLFVVGPCVHKWYSFLGRMFGEKSTMQVVAKKLALDQMFFAPFMFGTIMSSQALLSGKSWEENKQKLEKEWWGATQRGWCVFSVANGINFALVPPPFRLLYNNGISFCWNTYLSNVNNRSLSDSSSGLSFPSNFSASLPSALTASAEPAPPTASASTSLTTVATRSRAPAMSDLPARSLDLLM